jgi:hypothetical protein
MSGDYEFLRYLFLVFGVLAILNWSRYGRRWRHRPWGRVSEDSAEERAALEAPLASVARLEARVDELENRLDFAERVIARRETHAIGQGR